MLELQGAISGTPASSLLRSPSGYCGNGTETSCSSQCDRYELKRVFSGESFRTECSFDQRDIPNDAMRGQQEDKNLPKWRKVFDLINLPTLLCLGLLLAKITQHGRSFKGSRKSVVSYENLLCRDNVDHTKGV